MNTKPPSPVDHPAAYTALSAGSVAAFVCLELKTRLGVDITVEEAGMLVAGFITAAHFLRGVMPKPKS